MERKASLTVNPLVSLMQLPYALPCLASYPYFSEEQKSFNPLSIKPLSIHCCGHLANNTFCSGYHLFVLPFKPNKTCLIKS